MRILLVRPHSEIQVRPVPIGLLYLARALTDAGHEVRIHDGRLLQTGEENIPRLLEDWPPDVVGITLFSIEWKAAKQFAKAVKAFDPGIRVVLGGPHVSATGARVMHLPEADHALKGEGEVTFVRLLQAYAEGADPATRDIGGLCWRDESGVHLNEKVENIDALDEIPYPAYDQIDLEPYFASLHGYTQNRLQIRRRAMPLFTTRGCPYTCVFCHTIFGRRLRRRSAENVLGELDLLVNRYGIEELHISDDIFNMDLKHAKSVLQGIIDRGYGLKIAFPNGIRADRVDDELVELMVRAGVYRAMVAIESGSPEVQSRMQKKLKLEVARNTIGMLRRAGINVGGFFMFGFKDETLQEMRQTVDFALSSELNVASFFFATPFPGTQLYDQALAQGFTEDQLEQLYHDNEVGYDIPGINLTRVSSSEMARLKRSAVRRFYFKPSRIWGNLRTIPNPYTLWHNFVYVLQLATRPAASR